MEEALIKRGRSKIKNQSGNTSTKSVKVSLQNISHFSVENTGTSELFVSFRSTLDKTNKITPASYREFKAGDNSVFEGEMYLHGNGVEASYSVNLISQK